MYADRHSKAMEEAIEETDRRRSIQLEYNRAHGITPRTIKKAIQDILVRKKEEDRQVEFESVELVKKGYNILVPRERKKLMKHLEGMMLEHAKNLEFEKAALVRDEIEELKQMG